MMSGKEMPAAGGAARGLNNDQRPSRIDANLAQDGLPVYAGATQIGEIRAKPHGWEAITAGGLNLGRFNHPIAGAKAVLARIGGAQ